MRASSIFLLAPITLACSSPPSTSSDALRRDAATDASSLVDAGADAEPALPDLTIDMGRSRVDLSIATEDFAADACELDISEQCVREAGLRRVLRFSVESVNLGPGDVALGTPQESNGFTYSACHDHYHFDGYASYRLLDAVGGEVLSGRKQAFCLLDSEPYTSNAGMVPKYNCLYQGLQAGWADVYGAKLPCQLLDITDIADGDYTLEVKVNPDGLLADESNLNNLGTIAIRIGDEALERPTEACPSMDARYLDRIEKECDWTLVGEFDCTPGTQSGAGCSQNCGMGSCTGDPMIRVCDASEANCTSSIALGDNNNRCGGLCPLASNFLCPASGRLAVYTASAKSGEPFSCNVVVGPGPDLP